MFESGSGIGVRGEVEAKRRVLGNTALMQQEGVDTSVLTDAADALRDKGACAGRFHLINQTLGDSAADTAAATA